MTTNRKRPKVNPDIRRRYALKSTYGLTIEQYDFILESQGNCCAICKTDTPNGKGRFHVDHDHATNEVRGLLCHHCNLALGNFKDNVSTLLSAIEYLNKSVKS
jgi:hypothetical protein